MKGFRKTNGQWLCNNSNLLKTYQILLDGNNIKICESA